MNISITKMNLDRDGQPLLMYIFTVKDVTGKKRHPKPEVADFKAFACYTPDEAMGMVRASYAEGKQILVQQRATIPMRDLVNAVNLPLLNNDGNIATFLTGLIHMNEHLMKDKKDRDALAKIITNLQKQYGN